MAQRYAIYNYIKQVVVKEWLFQAQVVSECMCVHGTVVKDFLAKIDSSTVCHS